MSAVTRAWGVRPSVADCMWTVARLRVFCVSVAGDDVWRYLICFFFFQAEDGIRDVAVTGVQTCALPICEGGFDPVDDGIQAGPGSNARTGSSSMPSSTGSKPPSRCGDGRTSWPRNAPARSEERRVGKECRTRGAGSH